jgi:hypothetical protein
MPNLPPWTAIEAERARFDAGFELLRSQSTRDYFLVSPNHLPSQAPEFPFSATYHMAGTMATLKQIQANRLNARKSTGPRSTVGKPNLDSMP